MALPLIFQGKDFAILLRMGENAAFSATTLKPNEEMGYGG